MHASFDGIEYQGSIVNMGIKDDDGNICYIIGVRKNIRQKLHKKEGDTLHVLIRVQNY